MTEGWVEILLTYDALEAAMVKDILESGGIEVVSRSHKVSPYPVNIGKIGEIRLYVKEDDVALVRQLLESEGDRLCTGK